MIDKEGKPISIGDRVRMGSRAGVVVGTDQPGFINVRWFGPMPKRKGECRKDFGVIVVYDFDVRLSDWNMCK
jgi:hypothetical protein